MLLQGNAARTGEMPGPGPAGIPSISWTFTTDEPVTSTRRESPIVSRGLVYAESPRSGAYFALDASTGQEKWRFPVAYGLGIAPGNVIAVDPASGQERWRSALPFYLSNSPLIVGDAVFASDVNAIAVVDSTTGALRWVKGPTYGNISTVVAHADGLLYAAGYGSVYAFNAETEEERWEFELEGPGIAARALPVSQGIVFAADWENGALTALDAATEPTVEKQSVAMARLTEAMSGACRSDCRRSARLL